MRSNRARATKGFNKSCARQQQLNQTKDDPLTLDKRFMKLIMFQIGEPPEGRPSNYSKQQWDWHGGKL